jgi:hypothetical protein
MSHNNAGFTVTGNKTATLAWGNPGLYPMLGFVMEEVGPTPIPTPSTPMPAL